MQGDSVAGPGSHTGSPVEQALPFLQSKRVLSLPLWTVSTHSRQQGRPVESPAEDGSHLAKKSMAATYGKGRVPRVMQPARSE